MKKNITDLVLIFVLAILPSVLRAADKTPKSEPQTKPSPATLENISVSEDKDRYWVLMKGNGHLEYNSSYSDNPPQVMLEFPNTKKKTKDAYQPKVNAFVDKIETSQSKKDGIPATRVIVKLKSQLDYKVTQDAEGYSLQLSVPQPKPVKLPPKRPVDENTDPVIGAEDLLEVSVFDLPQFSTTARVGGDGTITMPLVGSVLVRGLTKRQVEQKIASSLEAKYINNANVSVNIKEYKSRQVSVLGSVKNPGPYYVISHRTLLQLISEVGGLGTDASGKCYIFREGFGKIEIDLHDLMVNGNQDLNVEIYPGDVVNFPPISKITIYVLGAVRSPGAIEINSATPVTLLAAIARAGGPTETANKSGIQIRRKDEKGEEQTIRANLKDILSGKTPDISLQAGDVVNVPESFF
jgi:polysaccharide biosynthesis/export protein